MVKNLQPAGSSSSTVENTLIFFAFLHYIHHTRPDPITKRISAVPPSKWRDVSYICLPINLLTFLLTAEEGRGLIERG